MNTFIEAVNAELKRRHPGLVTLVGWKERSRHTQPPSVVWTASAGDFGPPVIREDAITQSLMGRVLRFNVEVWGDDPSATNTLVKSVLRVLHRLGTAASYTVEGEQWEGLEGSGGAILGEIATLTVGIRDDIDDDTETTAEPDSQAPPTGGFDPHP